MNKQLLASLLSLLLVAGLAPMSNASSAAPCCSSSTSCTMDMSKVLTKEECQRFCKAKAAAIAKDPSLAKPENRRKLCRTIVKADPSMKPICMKLRTHCRQMKREAAKSAKCHNNSSSMSSSQGSAEQSSASSSSSSSSSAQQPADASSSNASMNSSSATQEASTSSSQQQSSASSAN